MSVRSVQRIALVALLAFLLAACAEAPNWAQDLFPVSATKSTDWFWFSSLIRSSRPMGDTGMEIVDFAKLLKRRFVRPTLRHRQWPRLNANYWRLRRTALVTFSFVAILAVIPAPSNLAIAASSGCPGRDNLATTFEVVPPGGGALHQAVLEGAFAQVKKLVAGGSDVDERNNWGATPLFNAVAFGHDEIAKYLIEHGADIKARDSADFTPVHLAALGCNEEMIRVLLEKGADVNAKSFEENGYTPLYSAISGGAPLSLVKLLVARGADVNARGSPDACAPLCLAKKVGRKDIATFLQSRGAR